MELGGPHNRNDQFIKERNLMNNTNFGQITGIQEKLDTTLNRMPRNRLPRVMKHYSPTGRRSHGRPLKRLLDT